MKTRRALPDVNVFLALAWPNHQFHSQAVAWYQEEGKAGWSTCAITQLGFVRLSSNPAFSHYAKTPLEALLLLRQWLKQPGHHYLGDSPAPAGDALAPIATRLQGHQQWTDAYLLAVARVHGLRLVTFDRKVTALAANQTDVLVL